MTPLRRGILVWAVLMVAMCAVLMLTACDLSDVLWNDPPARDTVTVTDTLYLPPPCHHHCYPKPGA